MTSNTEGFFRLVGKDGFDYVGKDLCVMFGRKTTNNTPIVSLGLLLSIFVFLFIRNS